MIYPWNTIELSFAKELITAYIDGSDSFNGKVLEIQSLSSVADLTGTRYFVDRYSDSDRFSEYDSSYNLLRKINPDVARKGKTAPKLIVLTEMKRTTPIPASESEEFEVNLDKLKDLMGKDFMKEIIRKYKDSPVLESLGINGLIESFDEFASSGGPSIKLFTKDPDCSVYPITDSSTWGRIWDLFFLGSTSTIIEIAGMDSKYAGLWFTEDKETGKYKRSHEATDKIKKQFLMIRSIDVEDYNKEVDLILGGSASKLEYGVNKNEIID